MAIYKNKDIETNIQATHVNLGNIGAQFYTEDENSASIRIYINHNDKPVNLETAGLTPILSLSMDDGSYFDNEPVDIVLAEQGLIQYKIRNNVVKHAGKVKATLRLKSETQTLHASEFSFTILNSGLDEQVAKEINIDLIGDKIEEILLANASKFKGAKGDTGEQGIQGAKGDKGDTGERGPQGIQGPMGDITGTYNWQKVKLTDNAGNILFLSETDFDVVETYNLTTGFYYVSNAKGLPSGVTNYGYMVYKKLNNNIQRIEFSPFNSTEMYIKNKVDTWMDWQAAIVSKKEIDNLKQTVSTQTQQIMVLQQLLASKG